MTFCNCDSIPLAIDVGICMLVPGIVMVAGCWCWWCWWFVCCCCAVVVVVVADTVFVAACECWWLVLIAGPLFCCVWPAVEWPGWLVTTFPIVLFNGIWMFVPGIVSVACPNPVLPPIYYRDVRACDRKWWLIRMIVVCVCVCGLGTIWIWIWLFVLFVWFGVRENMHTEKINKNKYQSQKKNKKLVVCHVLVVFFFLN